MNDLLQQILKSDVPSIPVQFTVPVAQREGRVGNYQAAFTTEVNRMFLITAASFIPMILLLCFGLNPQGKIHPQK